ncbi:nucleobase cation symporter-1 family protein [Aspergillus mulundensis]|uniref:Putative NCS1 nucleoside transporter n=1 Tax=Aspergillus mulundensis TaxID=1810919 RepID=A0A3D8SBR7_9EURO|nr:putative NCS1 nucleoside transporter [Aspergillus mulundensis]RDW83631.1 putative NCS1 nucleoside transporter [Aspergillus mulundensis]
MAAKSPFLSRLLRRLEVNRDTDAQVDIYVNKDTRPLPPSRRPYGPWHFVGLWMVTGSFNVGGWTTGSSLISLGLNVWQAMLAIIIAHTFVGFVCVAGGHPGAKWHIGFPIWMKQNWGIWGYLFPMAIRVFLSFVWTATNTWYGSQCLKVLLTCIWPSFLNLDGDLANGAMKVYDMVAFVLYFLLCLPLAWFSPENYKKPFMFASVTVATTVFVLLIWSTVRADGGGALLRDTSSVSGIEPATGSALGWAFVSAITANIGSIATHMWSQSDYTRYARKPGDQVLAQIIMVPLGTIIVACIGIICTSCAATLYPQEEGLLWNPYDFLDAVRRNEDTRGARAAVAFASIAFMLSQFGMVVASNLVVAGIDLAALLPRYFTIRRGGYFTIVFAFVLQPWSLLNSATSFLTVVGSFNIFLGPLMGIMFADYFLLRKTTMKLTHMYGSTPASIYWYTGGWNWRAAVAWVFGTWYLVPGLAQRAMASGEVWAGWTRLYQLAWFLGCLVSGLAYLGLDWVAPMPGKRKVDDEDYFGTFEERDEILGVDVDVAAKEGALREKGEVTIAEKGVGA